MTITPPCLEAPSLFPGELGPYATLLRDRSKGIQVSSQDIEREADIVINGGLKNRFIYQIKQGSQTVGYAIGTYHFCNRAMATDPILHEVVKRCNHLFLESIEESKLPAPQEVIDHKSIGLVESMDSSLIKPAEGSEIAYSGLETADELLELDTQRKQLTLPPYPAAAGINLWITSRSKQEKLLEILEAYQQGNAQQVYSYTMNLTHPLEYELTITARNKKWLYGTASNTGLIQHLKQCVLDQKTICVAVGTIHLLGKKNSHGLIATLRKEGFEVTRLDKVETTEDLEKTLGPSPKKKLIEPASAHSANLTTHYAPNKYILFCVAGVATALFMTSFGIGYLFSTEK